MTSEEVYLLRMSLLLILSGFLLFVIVFSIRALWQNRKDLRELEKRRVEREARFKSLMEEHDRLTKEFKEIYAEFKQKLDKQNDLTDDLRQKMANRAQRT